MIMILFNMWVKKIYMDVVEIKKNGFEWEVSLCLVVYYWCVLALSFQFAWKIYCNFFLFITLMGHLFYSGLGFFFF